MRPPIAAELLLFARVLLCSPKWSRGRKARAILNEIVVAERHHLVTGRHHPKFGDGSMMDRCYRLHPCAEPIADDPDFLHALVTAAEALLRTSKA
jgi:hypothetical protein